MPTPLKEGSAIGVVNTWPVKDSNFASDRWYKYEETGDQVPGVSAVKDIVRKPNIEAWKRNNIAAYAADHAELIGELAATDRDGALSLLGGKQWADSKKKANRGSEIHAMCESIMRAAMRGEKAKFKATPDDLRYLRNFARFVKEFDVRPVAVELAVWSVEHLYAGRLDLLAWLKIDDEWRLCVVDYKTGESGVWPDAAIQQTAYLRAERHIDQETGEMEPGWPDVTLPELDAKHPRAVAPEAAFALWLRPNGYAMLPLDTSDATWDEFLRRRGSYEWELKRAKAVVGKAINENPLVRKWKPKS